MDHSPYNTPVPVELKPNDSYYLVQDFRTINNTITPIHSRVPNLYNILSHISPSLTSLFQILKMHFPPFLYIQNVETSSLSHEQTDTPSSLYSLHRQYYFRGSEIVLTSLAKPLVPTLQLLISNPTLSFNMCMTCFSAPHLIL